MVKNNLVLFFLVLIVGFGAGVYFEKSQMPPPPIEGVINQELGQPEKVDFSLFWDAWRVIEENFVDQEKIDYQKMIYGAISGMVDSLKDSYTVFLSPEQTKIFEEDVSGEFQGVGMEIGIKNGELQVIAPLEGTPAQKAGLRSGDKIIKINDLHTLEMTINEAVGLIRGPKGTEVILTIFRDDWNQPKDFKITRDVIEIPSLKWEILEAGVKGGDIAYLKLYHFSEKSRTAFRQAAIEILASPSRKIILDLRNNPGGYLEVAQDIAGWFLERGQTVVIEDSKTEKERKVHKAMGNAKLLAYPLVVLINQGSASGSEILAGSLRDNRGILLIGKKSFGKGSVQELKKLREGSLKITTAKWLTPNNELITNVGLTPDIEVEITEKDYEDGKDPQLDKAIEIIKAME